MGLILTRSPYFVDSGAYNENADLILEIGNVGFSIIYETYDLNFRNAKLIDISPLINDFFSADTYTWNGVKYTKTAEQLELGVRITIRGSIAGVEQPDAVETHIATQGYLFSTDKYNGIIDNAGNDLSKLLEENGGYAGSSDIVYKLDRHNLRLPAFDGGSSFSITKAYMKNGEAIQIDSGDSEGISYLDRVNNNSPDDSPTVEDSLCSQKFFRETVMEDIDEVILSTSTGFTKKIKVITKQECKYKPYRVTFKNRWGVYEDLWFFKRSFTNMSVMKEDFRSNSIKAYNSASINDDINGVKTYRHFNVNAKESITLNSDWVDERLNESFRQMMLSEDITLYDVNEDKTYNVNCSTSEIKFKDHVTDKVINYQVKFDFAHEVINNVG